MGFDVISFSLLKRELPKLTHARNGGRNIWVQPTEPKARAVGDIWIQI